MDPTGLQRKRVGWGVDDGGARHERAAGAGGRRAACGRSTLAALDADPVWSASAMALTEALPAIDRLTDQADPAPRPRGRRPARMGSPPRRPGRSTLPRPGGRAVAQPAGPAQRRHPLRRRRAHAGPDPVRHVRRRPHRRRHRPRLRRGQFLTRTRHQSATSCCADRAMRAIGRTASARAGASGATPRPRRSARRLGPARASARRRSPRTSRSVRSAPSSRPDQPEVAVGVADRQAEQQLHDVVVAPADQLAGTTRRRDRP